MKWFRRFLSSHDDSPECLAPKIEASVHHQAALDRFADVRKQSVPLEQINHRNHFSESLTKAFGERPPSPSNP